MVPRVSSDCTYIFGNDPAWGVANNRLAFANGIKMKMSVIFGVLHMQIGVFHKFLNTIYHGHWAHFITECIGGSIILLGLFGWMDLLIFLKWTKELDIENHNPAEGVFPVNFKAKKEYDITDNCALTRFLESLEMVVAAP